MRPHDLDGATDGTRGLDFFVADLSGVLGDDIPIMSRLEDVLKDPSVIQTAPLSKVMPLAMRLMASKDLTPSAWADDLVAFCRKGIDELLEVDSSGTQPETTEDITQALWADGTLDRSRIRLAIALWALVSRQLS